MLKLTQKMNKNHTKIDNFLYLVKTKGEKESIL